MKNIILAGFCLILSSFCFSQDLWKSEEIEVLNRFGLDKNDPRGIIFYSNGDCVDGNFPEIKSAVEAFLQGSIKKDLSNYCIIELKQKELIGIPLDIHQIVQLYLQNNE